MLPTSAGAPWTIEEERRLYHETGEGMPIADIAAAHDRTTGAIRARQKHMGLRDEAGTLITPLPEFRSALRSKGEQEPKDEGKVQPGTPSSSLRPKRRASSVLRAAGGTRREHSTTTAPSVESTVWPPDFPRDGDWIEQLWHALRHDTHALLSKGRQPDTLTERAIDIVFARLTPADDFHPAATLEELGHKYGVTRERIRQVQTKALRRLAGRVQRKGSLTAQVLKEVESAVPGDQAHAPLSWFGAELARQDCRTTFIEFMFMAFLGCSGVPPKEARRLVEQAMPSLLGMRRTEASDRRRYEASDGISERARGADDFVLGILKNAVWPNRLTGRSIDLAGLPPLRDCRYERPYYSKTLQRLVSFDSRGEKRLIQALDIGTVVTEFTEQPVKIAYRLDGRNRIYIPDLLVRTDTDLYFVIEVKARPQLADRTTLAKAEAAASQLGERGIGYCLTDANGFSLDDLRALEPDGEFRRRLRGLLQRNGTVTRDMFEGAFGREGQRRIYDQLQSVVLREGLRYDTQLTDHPHVSGRYIFDFRLSAR
ncbi:TnsA endonuclease N-terminal domain-containing protein [Neorhizobium petrolearium]|uniref:TnsA endonuclease N-terminal domain-containing protein n=1 Tax=Neorhizobium petrolearium TaxID=515361 RepID=UPI003F15EB16